MKKLLLVCLCLLATGCNSTLLVPQYSFVFVNASGAELDKVSCANQSGFYAIAGYLGIGNHASDELIPGPIPDQVTVTWQTADGKNHSQLVPIKNQLPFHFSGEVVLTFTPEGNVVVGHQPYFKMPK